MFTRRLPFTLAPGAAQEARFGLIPVPWGDSAPSGDALTHSHRGFRDRCTILS